MENKKTMYEQKQNSMKRLRKYASVINLVLNDYSRKSTDETMMIKSFRKSNPESTNRKTHSENLENIAGLMAEGIGLNVPVVKLMARYHDIGHTFLGHSGEWWLSEIKKNLGLGCYVHNSIGVRDLLYTHDVEREIRDALYQFYGGENQEDIENVCEDLWIIFDGINSHNGELSESTYIPNFEKTKEDSEQELLKCHTKEGYDESLIPGTAEASLMRLADKIVYIPFDMIDGLREGMTDRLDEEYIDVLVPILTSDGTMTAEEAVRFVNNAVTKQKYNPLAHRLQLIFAKDVIQNSTKEKIAMSEKMSERMHKLRDINNEKVVKYVLMEEDHETYPKALEELMHECKEIILKEKILERLNGAEEDMRLSAELEEKYKDTPYFNFVKYIARTSSKDFEWTKNMVKEAQKEAIEEELEESLEVAKKNEVVGFAQGQEKRARRIRFFAKVYREQIGKMEAKGYQLEDADYEQMKTFQMANSVPKLYPDMKESMACEFGAKYLANLSDTEFMDLLKATGKVSEEQEQSLTRKYKDIDLEKEYMTHGQWDKISAEQSLARKGRSLGEE